MQLWWTYVQGSHNQSGLNVTVQLMIEKRRGCTEDPCL